MVEGFGGRIGLYPHMECVSGSVNRVGARCLSVYCRGLVLPDRRRAERFEFQRRERWRCFLMAFTDWYVFFEIV